MGELERRLVVILEEYEELSELGNPSEERIKTSKEILTAVADAVDSQFVSWDEAKDVIGWLRTQAEGKEENEPSKD